MATRKPHIRTALGRGIRGKCPRCGEGELFQRWIVTHERCPACHLLYDELHGGRELSQSEAEGMASRAV